MAVTFRIEYKKNDGSSTRLACESGSKHVIDEITSVGQNWDEQPQDWSRNGFTFEHWNTAADDSGTSYNGGDFYTGAIITLYAIWQADTPVGADVSVTLGNTEIASLSDTGSVTLATAGTYVNEDITIDYTKSGGGSGGGGGSMLVTITHTQNGSTHTYTMDKTAGELKTALDSGIALVFYDPYNYSYYSLYVAGINSLSDTFVRTIRTSRSTTEFYTASSASSYPTYSYSTGGGGND